MTADLPEAAVSRDEIRVWFRAFAEIYTPGTSPLYEALSRIVLRHEALIDLATNIRPGQPAPNMLFGAVHMVLLQDRPKADLARFYPSLGGDATPGEPGLEDAFLAFCEEHRERLRAIIAARVTNTNEVRRSTCLMPAFVEASRLGGGAPFHLVEIGPSAGLNLIWDRYAYRYTVEGGAVLTAGRAGAAGLLLECALRGRGRPRLDPGWPPRIASRLGIERDPVNVADAQDRLWLRALIWPEHRERAERLERALALAASDPPPIRTGDALDLLPEVLAALPAGEPVCVEHSAVLYQFTAGQRRGVHDALAEAALVRPVLRVSFESRIDDPEVLLVLTDVSRDTRQDLAFCDPHGAWLEWRVEAEL